MAATKKLKYWQGISRQQKESGLSIKAFCQKHKIGYSTFYAWKRKLSKRFDSGFIEVKDKNPPEKAPEPKETSRIREMTHSPIELGCGDIKIRVNSDLELTKLSQVIKALHLASGQI